MKLIFKKLDDADIKLKLKLEPFEKNGETYVKIAKFKLNFSISKFQIHLENLFNGKNIKFSMHKK